jgi:predicted metal-dependent HD superfamily phosphohydrolase
MDHNSIYKKIEDHVNGLFDKAKADHFYYHTLEHTQKVVARTKEIAAHYNLTEKEMLIVYTAAWFHDTGYLYTSAAEHEEKSASIMRSFMKDLVNDEEVIDAAESCILSTKPPQNPKNLLDEIVCDADTYHLGTKEFKETNKLVKKEFEATSGTLDKLEWMKGVVKFMESHHYHTSYCKDLLKEKKNENLMKLKNKLAAKEEAEREAQREITGPLINPKSALMTKGIQTMLRLTSDNHLELSGMADGKANILITVNSIIISVVLSVLMRRLEIDTHLAIPTIILLLFSVGTIVLAILATRPKIDLGKFDEQDIINKKTNLLFFGNFHRATLEEYENAMRKMMGDSDYLYGSLIKDIYHLGVVLGRKYKLIRWAYNVFMTGIILSVLAFAIAVYLNNQGIGTTSGNSAAMPL